MKQNHALAVEYYARLLRFNTTWCGTTNRPSIVIAHVRPDAVAEFQIFLHRDAAPNSKTKYSIGNKSRRDRANSHAYAGGSRDNHERQRDRVPKLFEYPSARKADRAP